MTGYYYTVRPGDTLSSIAARNGLRSWKEIYDHAGNAEFRRKRPSPDRTFPGDVLFIPQAGVGVEQDVPPIVQREHNMK
jgi:hypothetical protein